MYKPPSFDLSAAESSGQELYSTTQTAVVRSVSKAKSRRRRWNVGDSGGFLLGADPGGGKKEFVRRGEVGWCF